jgi:putative heme-binding domain-containing protein
MKAFGVLGLRRALAALLLVPGLVCAQEEAASPLAVLVRTLAKIESPAAQANILRGLNVALKGRMGVNAPEGWAELYEKLKASPNAEVRELALTLGATFGSDAVLGQMRTTLADAAAPVAARRSALDTLASRRDAGALPVLLDLVKGAGPLREPALRALAGYDDPRIAAAIIASFPALGSAEKREALNTLISRAASARALLAAIEAGTVPRAEITAPLARQLQNLGDQDIDAWLAKHWGAVKTTSAEKQKQIAQYKEFLDPGLIARADVHRGRAIYSQTCAACHELHGVGGKIGPHLTGGYEDIDYLLQNILDPNAVIGKDYQQTFLTLRDGQVVSGIVAGEDGASVTLKTLGDTMTVQREQIAGRKLSEQSMMPEGLLAALDEPGVRDLFLYLRQKQQTRMLATPLNANDFFNGTDLARWRPSSDAAWKVEAGEIVGRSTSAKPVNLQSDLVADAFRFTAKVKVVGEKAAAEIVLRGSAGPRGFVGSALSLGGPTPANVWLYAGREAQPERRGAFVLNAGEWVDVEVVANAVETELKLDGQGVLKLSPGASLRTAFAFFVAQGELRVRAPKIEIAGP